jgi:hypothetical protein
MVAAAAELAVAASPTATTSDKSAPRAKTMGGEATKTMRAIKSRRQESVDSGHWKISRELPSFKGQECLRP